MGWVSHPQGPTSLDPGWYIYIYYCTYTYTWNPNDPCFDWKRPCFGGMTFKNRGRLGSRHMYIHITSSGSGSVGVFSGATALRGDRLAFQYAKPWEFCWTFFCQEPSEQFGNNYGDTPRYGPFLDVLFGSFFVFHLSIWVICFGGWHIIFRKTILIHTYST